MGDASGVFVLYHPFIFTIAVFAVARMVFIGIPWAGVTGVVRAKVVQSNADAVA